MMMRAKNNRRVGVQRILYTKFSFLVISFAKQRSHLFSAVFQLPMRDFSFWHA